MNKITFKYSFLLLKQFFQLSRMKWSEQEKRAHIISEKVKKQGIKFLPAPVYGTGVICLCVCLCVHVVENHEKLSTDAQI